ncbi:hypothetical protein J6590_025835 [Homalodisca vitripennis]|nr:hypothetical protein J6590_025835 [Homalodisca vitripennis]
MTGQSTSTTPAKTGYPASTPRRKPAYQASSVVPSYLDNGRDEILSLKMIVQFQDLLMPSYLDNSWDEILRLKMILQFNAPKLPSHLEVGETRSFV